MQAASNFDLLARKLAVYECAHDRMPDKSEDILKLLIRFMRDIYAQKGETCTNDDIKNELAGMNFDALNEKSQEYHTMCHKIMSTARVLVCSVNDIADSIVRDAVNQLQKTKHYKQLIKQNAKTTLVEIRKAQNYLRYRLDANAWQLWMDIADNFNEFVATDIYKLRIAIKSLLDKHNIPESDLKSHVLTADAMLIAAMRTYEDYYKVHYDGFGLDLSWELRGCYLDKAHAPWGRLTNLLTGKDPNVDLNADPNCKLTVNIIIKKLCNPKNINEIGRKALMLNYDNLTDEQKEELELITEEYDNDSRTAAAGS